MCLPRCTLLPHVRTGCVSLGLCQVYTECNKAAVRVRVMFRHSFVSFEADLILADQLEFRSNSFPLTLLRGTG